MVDVKQKIKLGGIFEVVCIDINGEEKWREEVGNLVTNEGLNHILDAVIHAATPTDPWYVALFEDDYTPLAGDTYASPGYTESTAYSQVSRPEYEEAAPSGQSITNSANPASFSINATKTIYGASIVGGSNKGDVASGEVLLCAAKFSSSKAVENGDTLNVTYTLSAADDGV